MKPARELVGKESGEEGHTPPSPHHATHDMALPTYPATSCAGSLCDRHEREGVWGQDRPRAPSFTQALRVPSPQSPRYSSYNE